MNNTTATVLAIHRDYTITDEPYPYPSSDGRQLSNPFTIYSPDGKVIDHADEENLKECIQTIDIIQDEIEADEERKAERRWHPGACFDRNYPENANNIRA